MDDKGKKRLTQKRLTKASHDLEYLIKLAETIEGKFKEWIEVGIYLTSYATDFRYPSDIVEPNQEELEQAFMSSLNFLSFVLSLLPDDVYPHK